MKKRGWKKFLESESQSFLGRDLTQCLQFVKKLDKKVTQVLPLDTKTWKNDSILSIGSFWMDKRVKNEFRKMKNKNEETKNGVKSSLNFSIEFSIDFTIYPTLCPNSLLLLYLRFSFLHPHHHSFTSDHHHSSMLDHHSFTLDHHHSSMLDHPTVRRSGRWRCEKWETQTTTYIQIQGWFKVINEERKKK